MTEFRKILDLINENSQELMKVHDSFDIELNNDLIIESGIVGFTEDAVIIQGDDKVLELLSENGALLEETDWSEYDKPTIDRVKKGVTPPVDRTDYDVPPAMRKNTKGKPGYELRKERLQSMHNLKEKMVMGVDSDSSTAGSKVLGENRWDDGNDEGTVPTEVMVNIIKRPFLTDKMTEKVGNVIGKYGPVRIMAAIEDYASGINWPRGQGINSKDPWHWAFNVIRDLEKGYYDTVDSVPVRTEIEITLPEWVRENSAAEQVDENQDSVALEEEKEMDLEQSRAELRRDPTTRAAAQAIIKAITTDCEPSSYCIASLTMTYGPEAIIKSLYSTATASEPEDIASPEAIDKLVQKFVRSLKYNAGKLTEEQELDDKRIKEIKEKIEFYKLMGNEKAAAELEGMLRAQDSKIKESKDKSSVSMPARKLYTQTYAKHCKTVKDSKKAEQLAYDAVKEKFGKEVLDQLKKYHARNETSLKESVSFKAALKNSTDQTASTEKNLEEAKYRGRTVSLNKPTKGDVKKRKVYVRKPNGNVVKVEFGDPNMRIKKSNPARRKSFRARHRCDNPGPKWKARYWSCRFW